MPDFTDVLGTLDPDSSTPVSATIAGYLRAAIQSGRLAPGDALPSQPFLAGHYGIARETAKRAVETLRREGLVVSRQGAGVFVRTRVEPRLVETSYPILNQRAAVLIANGDRRIDSFIRDMAVRNALYDLDAEGIAALIIAAHDEWSPDW